MILVDHVLVSYQDHERSPLTTRADRIVATAGRPAVTDSSGSPSGQGGSNHRLPRGAALSRTAQ
jgi:hypothetical protein